MMMEVKLLSFRILFPAFLAALIYAAASPFFFKPPAISITSEEVADMIFSNATIFTCDAELPFAEAMAIRKGRIVQIGSSSELQGRVGPKTKFTDLKGRFVVPGFIDSHLHLISGGLQMSRIELHDVCSRSEFIEKVRSIALGAKEGQWILGGGWNNQKWGGELPSASWIDPFTEDTPVWIYRLDGHMGLANSKALRLAQITDDLPDPEGGSLIKDENGRLTGILVDSAINLIIRHIPEPTIQERRDALARATKRALSEGVTAVVDFGRFFPGSPTSHVWEDFYDVYKWGAQTGNLLLRVCVYFPLQTWRDVYELSKGGQKLSENLRIGGVKTFADGSLGSLTALFNEPYNDDPTNFGLEVFSQSSILKEALEADKHELQIAIHAIGDAANDRVLAIYRELNATNDQRKRRSRIEHAQHLSRNGLQQFRSMDVIASMQPEHLLDDASYASRRLGEERAISESYLFNSLLAGGVTLAFGSDWPVAPLSPLGGMRAAVNRTPAGWRNPWIPSECIDIVSALYGYTISAAYASFMDDDIGSISVGKFADFVVLSDDLLKTNAQVNVLETYKGGIRVFPR